MKKIASNAIVSACSQRASAIKKHLGAKDEIFVDGEQVRPTALARTYQIALDTRSAAVTAKGVYKTALAERDAAEAKRRSVDEALQPYIVQRFGATSTEAHDFGFAPKKVTEKSPATKAKAVLLAKATREARGTKSKKAKEQIKGTLSAETVAALEALSASGSDAAPTGPTVTPSPAAPPAPPPSVSSTPVAPTVNGVTLNGAAHS